MKFVLNEIRLWYKDEKAQPTSYNFEPDKVNVITGDATTGKTSFWSIITYCLLAGEVNIADAINARVAWYGINFTINKSKISIARRAGDSRFPSLDIYYDLGELPTRPYTNSEISNVRANLDKEFGINESVKFPFNKELGKSKIELSYAYFLLFNSLTEDIIGTSKNYFDTTFYGDEKYAHVLKHILELAIGINDVEIVKARERVQQINSEVNKIKAQIQSKNRTDKKFERELFILINRLKEANLVDYDRYIDTVEEAQFTIEEILKSSQKVVDQSKIVAKIEHLKKELFKLKAELSSIERYRREYNSYKRNLNKSADSLKPIKFLSTNLSDQLIESYETIKFIGSLDKSLRNIQNNLSTKDQEPVKVSGEAKDINRKIHVIETEIDQLTKLTSYQPEGSRILAIGEVKGIYQQLVKQIKTTNIEDWKIAKLEEEKSRLEVISQENEKIKFSMYSMLNESIQRNFDKLASMGSYKGSKTVFNPTNMVLQLQPKGQLFPIENIGSKSNHMLMHLCFYLGLHEHMIKVGQTHTPQFLFIDQPSIPYYSGNDSSGNDDKSKLLDAFSLINAFISFIQRDLKESFQIFMVEHAPKEYWTENSLSNFHTVEEFINGNGLIPKDIYN